MPCECPSCTQVAPQLVHQPSLSLCASLQGTRHHYPVPSPSQVPSWPEAGGAGSEDKIGLPGPQVIYVCLVGSLCLQGMCVG